MKPGEQDGIGFNVSPEVANPEILVLRMLVVVGVDDRHTDYGEAEAVKYVHRGAPSKRRLLHDVAERIADGRGDRLRHGKVHRSPGGWISATVVDAGNAGVRSALLRRRLSGFGVKPGKFNFSEAM